jgi:hypothetical protein
VHGQALAFDVHLPQRRHDVVDDVGRHVDDREALVDANGANGPRIHADLVGHGAHEIARSEPHVPASADLDRRHGHARLAVERLPLLRLPLARSRVRLPTFEDRGNLRLGVARARIALLQGGRRDVEQIELLAERRDDPAKTRRGRRRG